VEGLKKVLKRLLNTNGPSFVHAKINRERVDVPRVSIKPVEIKNRFMKELAED